MEWLAVVTTWNIEFAQAVVDLLKRRGDIICSI